MFKIGDIVTPIEGKIGHGYKFKIIGINDLNNLSDVKTIGLKRITEKINPMYGPIDKQLEIFNKVENFIWFDTELELIR